jgi:hypothetical protein
MDNPIDCLPRHDFFALWPGVHVTMHTRQVTKLAHVHLKNFGAPTSERDGVIRQSLRKAIRPLLPANHFLSMRFDHFATLTARLIAAKSATEDRNFS